MLGGCSVSRMNETAQKLDASREALRTCLAAHQTSPDACAAEKEMFEADRETYEARAAAINSGAVEGDAAEQFLQDFAKGLANRRAQAAYQPLPAPNPLGQNYRITTPSDVVGQQVTVTPMP
jgi:hypothetical protein